MTVFKRLFKIIAFICFAAIIAGALTLFHSRYIAPYSIKIETAEISSQHIAKEAGGTRIVLFADTHIGEFYDLARFKDVVDAINAQDPDIVIFAGDLIDTFDEYTEGTEALSALLSEINAPLGKFCVFGNHDYGGGAEREYPDIMEQGGFNLLVNENYLLDSLGLNIIGIDDVLIGYGDIDAAAYSDPSYYNIVIAHEPDIADEVADRGADLMLSAHTHGRQINIQFLDEYILPPYGRKYIEGFYTFTSPRNMTLYVTRGIGITQLPFRFNSSPEISVFVLNHAEAVQ